MSMMPLRVLLMAELLQVVSMVMASNVLYSIPEESKLGSLIGNIPDSISLDKLVTHASMSYMKYSFLSIDSNFRKYFALDAENGDLRLSSTEILDREVVCQFDVTCVINLQIAIQSTHTQFFRKVLISIDVIDINDHSPSFKENFTLLTISESVQIPTSYPLPSAIDKDSGVNNSLQSYEIFPKDAPFELSYSKSNPNLMLRVVRELDHETRDFYSFRIIARDGGNPPREGVLNVDITVEDVNDNAPVFTQESYAKVVDETVTRGSLLFTLTATDADSGKNGQVRYRLSPQQPASIMSMFSVDEVLGDVRLAGDFQNTDTELYKVDIEATDMADQPFTTITTASIQVEDTINSIPKLLISYLSPNNYSSISEYANIGVAVAHILVRDTDKGPNGIVQCKLSNQGYFQMQNYDVKEYNIIVAEPLDRESSNIHNVTVECSDAGLPPLSVSATLHVKVIDENDNAPEFKDRFYNVTFRENNDIEKEILKVTAVDRDDPATGNGRITYSLQDVASGEFLINPDTGVIKAMVSFDYEMKREINFTVVAEDNGNPRRSTKAAIIVNILDENDQVPYFTQSRFTISVSEYARPGDLIGEIKAFDFEQGENGQFEISLIPGTGRSKKDHISNFFQRNITKDKSVIDYEVINDEMLPFQVRSNGSLYLNGEIDHETRTSYEFQVRVIDKGDPPLSDSATVVIGIKDENDNAPQILHPNISEMIFPAQIGSDAPVTLVTLEAVDIDNGRNGFLTYTITARNDSRKFEIDGEGQVKRTRELESRDTGTYKLSVVVMDTGTPPLSDIRTFYIHVAGGNETAGKSGALNDQYIIITLTLVCVTILLSITIVLVIVIMKRLDNRRKNSESCSPRGSTYVHSSRLVSAYTEPSKTDKLKKERTNSEFRNDGNENEGDKKLNDSQFGFSSLSGSVYKNFTGDSGNKARQINTLNLPISASRDGDKDLATLQLQPVLLPTYQNSQVVVFVPEDGISDSSGDTITSDSGRGASDEDISSSLVTVGDSMDESPGNLDDNHHPYSVTFGHNVSPDFGVKQHAKCNQRKHVTFMDIKQVPQNINQPGGSRRSISHGNKVNSGNASSLKLLEGSHQQPPLSTFGRDNSGQQSPLRDMDVSFANENNNAHAENKTFSSFSEYLHAKNSTKISPRELTCGQKYGRDSPCPQTTTPEEQYYNHLLATNGKDPVPRSKANVSPRENKRFAGLTSQDNSVWSSSSQIV